MKQHETLTLGLALLISSMLHIALVFGLFHMRFAPIADFEREVRKRFDLKEVDIKQLKTHVETLPVPSTKTFRYEQVGALAPKPAEVESVRQSMQTLHFA